MSALASIGGDRLRPVAATHAVAKRYLGVTALEDVSFAIRPGEVRAVLGKNGAGKSTLIRLLSGVETPDEGTVEIDGRPLHGGGIRESAARGVATVYQELSLVPEMSVADNFGLGAWPRTRLHAVDHGRMRRDAAEGLRALGVEIDPGAEVGSLTLAEQQMVEIARAMRSSPRLLILDEPTSALAAREVAIVLEAVRRIAAGGVAVIYVSHRMDEIRRIADSATVMRDGRLIETVDIGSATTQEIVRLMLGDAVAQEASAVAAETAETADGDAADAPVLLEVRGLSVPPKLDDVSFRLRRGEVLGIAGLQGSGRTELVRAIAGFDRAQAGEIVVDGEHVRQPTPARMLALGIGMTPENRKADGIVPDLGVDENLVLARFPRSGHSPLISRERIRSAAEELRRRLDIKAARMDLPIGSLSGGNQQKAVIGRWLHAGSRILLLDEPTRGVDVESKAQIYRLARELARNGAAVLFVSSELEELPLVCDRVLVLRAGRIVAEHSAPDLSLDAIVADTITEHA